MAKLALTIGIDKYGSGSDLQNCVNDANSWQQVLAKRGFTVASLVDKAATGANMRDAIGGLIAKAKKGDSLVFTYSGHGSFVKDLSGDEPSGFDQCLCPVDVFTNGPIVDDELYKIYANRPLGIKLVVISDSCHSGTVSRFMSSPGMPLQARDKIRFMPPNRFLSAQEEAELITLPKLPLPKTAKVLPAGRHACLLLSGCRDEEYSYDGYGGQANGAFTAVMLNTLPNLPAKSSYLRYHRDYRKLLPSPDYPQSPAILGSTTMVRWRIFE